MADLKQFTWPGLHGGMAVDIYLNRWPQIGTGTLHAISSEHLSISGQGSFFGKEFKASIEVTMPDLSPTGVCKVSVNGDVKDCDYHVDGGRLYINHPMTQLTLYDSDKSWSWVGTTWPVSAWIGVWPQGDTLSVEHTIPPQV